jgi:deoxycytidine triphosphate deaminase
VAGAIDSLGQIDYSPPGEGHRALQLGLVNSSQATLEGLQELLGVGTLRERAGGEGYRLVVNKAADVQHILSQTLPYLVHKRDTAYRALAELKATKSIVVDPKDFDAKSFVDFQGDVCVIPPNSFALSRTVEYFRIPRSVLTVCLGKSSYARCFRGDTRVALVDGTAPTLEEMATRAQDGETFWGYSMAGNGRPMVARLDSPRYIGRDNLVEVVLDSGVSIFCTPDHLFMLRDGRWMEAGNLRPERSLMPLRRSLEGNREAAKRQVVTVRDVPGVHDVYCLTVPQTGNFALQSGVFVHNCGIIVNVTPFEPQWQGFVTLEISNTTPLPAKIYANEGIAQVLFFEADQECDVSYADRKGKYQAQQTIVLPRL